MDAKAENSARPVRVLAQLDAGWVGSRRMTGGAMRFAALHPGVEVRICDKTEFGNRRLAYFKSWAPDGVILGPFEGNGDREKRDLAALRCRAAVFVNAEPPISVTVLGMATAVSASQPEKA